ncbi:MAG: hypothetical protein IJI40_09450 [Firmicutes bacterium]|nr:hypothetical protein [Bacillota bacterium]
MKKRFVKSQHEPKMIDIQGHKYPALFSMAAMAEVEELTGVPYAVFFDKLAKNEGTIKEQAALICACLKAGGTEVTLDEIMDSLDLINDFPAVLTQIVELVSKQAPEGEEGKNRKA